MMILSFFSFRILFRSQDLSEMKEYLHSQWSKILEGDVSIQDFIYAKAVKLGTYRYWEFSFLVFALSDLVFISECVA